VARYRVFSFSCPALLVLAVTAGACSGSAESGRAGKADDALQVAVVEVQAVDVPREVEAVGTLNAQDEAVVSAEVEGRVARLAADMGDRVVAGAPLVLLDAEKLRYRLEEQRGGLEQARARLGARGSELPPIESTPEVMSALAQRKEAEQRVTRARQLAERKLLPAEDLERAETQLETARAAHEAALAAARNLEAEITARAAAVKGADRDLQDAVIRAPFEGVVAERLVSAGQFVRIQTPVMRIVRMHPLRLTAEIPERFGPAVRVGHALSVRVDAYPDRAIEGRITRLSPDVNLKSRAFAIEGEVPNADGALKPGTFARVRIVTDRIDRTIAIPVSAVQTRYGRSVVFVVRDGKLAASEVKLGDRLGPRVEVLEGVAAGATIVSENVEGLSDGLAVKPRTAPPPPPAGGTR
jgi:membrane fusion protein (multidrug efflux system)